MASERVQRRIDSLLDEAEEAIGREDWQVVAARARAVLVLDAHNADARAYLTAVERQLREPQEEARMRSSGKPPPD